MKREDGECHEHDTPITFMILVTVSMTLLCHDYLVYDFSNCVDDTSTETGLSTKSMYNGVDGYCLFMSTTPYINISPSVSYLIHILANKTW